MDSNVQFCRLMLREVADDVRAILPEVRVMRDGWVYHHDGDHWEFQVTVERHGLQKFYWHGSASNAYEARANGWSAYLEKFHADDVKAREAARA